MVVGFFIFPFSFCIVITALFLSKVEVFNLLFVKEINKKLMVHCQDCARKTSPALDGFKVLNQVGVTLQTFYFIYVQLIQNQAGNFKYRQSVCLHWSKYPKSKRDYRKMTSSSVKSFDLPYPIFTLLVIDLCVYIFHTHESN